MPRIFGAFNTIKIDQSIVVNRSVTDTFAFVTDPNNAGEISEHLVDIGQPADGEWAEGAQYPRTLLIHGQPNAQVVTVTLYEKNTTYVTSTELYGFEIKYAYRFTPVDDTTVQVSLTKEASGHGLMEILTPLIRHLLTRPEHDGGHLVTLKEAIESQNGLP